jgi:two-component system chemotaxis response regulator CheY
MKAPMALINKHILLVDDVASMRNMTKSILRGAGFTKLYEAQDGVAALKILKNQPIDLVICDWVMPNMNGLELFKEAEAEEKLKDIPFLMLTGSSDVNKVQEAIAAGVTDYIIKPYQPNAFLTKIFSKL